MFAFRRVRLRVRGFTLTELLVVIAIIAVTAAILFSVFIRAKGAAYEVPCTSNLRQIWSAVEVYRSDFDGGYPLRLGNLVADDASVRPVLKCPSDTTSGANAQATSRLGFKVSYFYWSPYPVGYREALDAADPDHGVAYCVLHGRRLPTAPGEAWSAVRDSTGLVLRLLTDGSIQRAEVGFHCGALSGGGRWEFRTEWSLLTSAPCTQTKFCDGCPDPCKDPRE